MTHAPFAPFAQALARGGPRRWALKTLAAGALSAGLLDRGTRSSAAQTDVDELFQQCLRACLASCTPPQPCPSLEACAASCSQALL